MNNKIVSTKRTSAIFLAIVLVTGTIALSSPSFIIKGVNAQGQPYYGYNSHGPEYPDNNYYNSYEPDYGMDSYKKPQIFPANKVSELGDGWWQWIISLDTSTNPYPFIETGQAACDVGLQDGGKLLFLVGPPSDPPLSGLFPTYDCKIEEGTSILFPIVNVFGAGFERDPPLTETEQRMEANQAMDQDKELHLEIDGIEVQNLEKKYRVDSPPGGFEFNAPPDNHFNVPIGPSTGVSDGIWILLKNLKPGEHTITFSATLDLTDIIGQVVDAGATYNLDVIPKYY